MSIADELLAAVGGAENVAALTRCWSRLRFELHDAAAVDQARVEAIPSVVIAVHQQDQFQVALRSGLLEAFDHLTSLLNHYSEEHHG